MPKGIYPKPLAEVRFWSKVNKDGPIPACCPDLGPCWEWTAGKDKDGYGKFFLHGRDERAHRVVYAWRDGRSIDEGLTLDHLCRNTSCVNVSHLESVTIRENILRGTGPPAINARKTHCRQGHPFSGDNLWARRRGGRACRTCANAMCRAYMRARRAAARVHASSRSTR